MAESKTTSLADLLATLPADRRLKLGAHNGSSFFYVGTVADVRENMDLYSRKLRNYARMQLINAQADLEQKLRNPPTLQRYAMAQVKTEKPDWTIDGFKAQAAGWLRDVKRMTANLNKSDRQYDAFADLPIREVLSHFDADPQVETDTTVIIVDGFEKGRYWMGSESGGRCSIGLSMYDNAFEGDQKEEKKEEEG